MIRINIFSTTETLNNIYIWAIVHIVLKFGKACEDVIKHTEVQILLSEDDVEKYQIKKNLSRYTIYNDNLADSLMEKKKIKLDKTRYVGMSMLILLKLCIYNFHYEFIIKVLPDSRILFCYQFQKIHSKMLS